MNKDELELLIGDDFKLTATVLPPNTTDKTVVWSSSDTSVAKVDAEGLVTAIGAGNAVITATCGSASATCQVTVNKFSQEIVWDQTFDNVKEGDVITLTATATSDLAVSYEITEGTSLASISGNILTVIKVGEIKITASQSGNAEYDAAEPVTKTITIASGIEDVIADVNGRYIVHNLHGVVILDTENTDDVKSLPQGIDIINGKKLFIK